MAEIDLVFLWHMHQPYYGDPVAGKYTMPWVRLHGIKGYYDMPLLLKEFPEVGFSINLTPSLMRQLREYVEKNIYDEFYDLSVKPASYLTTSEKIFLLRNFFLCRKDTMIMNYAPYQRLFFARGTRPGVDLERAATDFSVQEFLDLQVWFNLTWFGFKASEEYPEIQELRHKGSRFTEADKLHVLQLHKEILAKLIPLYKELWAGGQLEVTTTPFYHPILPLLCDSDIAREASPQMTLPPRFSHLADAHRQVKTGLEYMEETFGRRPVGMWPGENAVSDEALRIIAQNGVTWVNTDEQLLRKTRPNKSRSELIYAPYSFQDTQLKVAFRDQEISDIIGFNYSRLESEVSVADFMRRMDIIKKQAEKLGRSRALVVIALDGENPWESFPESGRDFLRALLGRLSSEPDIQVSTMSQALERYAPEKLEHLAPGSWIKGNFEIWIGGAEENKAWDYLGQVRKDFEEFSQTSSGAKIETARNELMAAEGSDWFWWYGDDFYSEIDTEFDNLFRMHLKNVYLALDKRPRLFLEDPVKFDHPVKLTTSPAGFISPIIDGRENNFYEWHDAGSFDVLRFWGGYYSQEPHFSKIYFGFDAVTLYLRLDPHHPEEIKEDLDVEIRFEKPRIVQLQFPYKLEKQATQKYKAIVCRDKEDCIFESDAIRKVTVFELAAPFADLGFASGEEVLFRVYLYSSGRAVTRYPMDGLIGFTVPDRNFEIRMWNV